MSDARVCATVMSLLLGFCACGSEVAAPKLAVTPPNTTMQPPRAAPSQQLVEQPRSNPGGQSGSIGSTPPILCTVSEKRQITAQDEALPGYTLEALHAVLRGQVGKPLALAWHVGPLVAARVTLSFELPGEATLVKHRPVDGPANDELSCAHENRVEERGTLRIRTSDGLLDVAVATDFVFDPRSGAHGPGAVLRHLIAMSELAPPLTAAITDALAAVGAKDSYAGIRVDLMRVDQDDASWELFFRLVPEDRERSANGTLELARAWHDWALPEDRLVYTPRAELAAACERSTPPPSRLAPDSDATPFNSVAGTWLLCSGNYPASVRIAHDGLRVAPDGGFVVLGFEAGELVEQPGLGRQGQLWPGPTERYFEFVGGSELAPAPAVPTFVPARRVDELLLPDSGPYGGLRGLRGQLEPASDGRTLRAGPIDTTPDTPDLRYVRTDLPVRRAAAPQWSAGKAAGMAGCAAHDQDLRLAVAADATRITGSFALCTGELGGAARLVLEPGGRFRALDDRGAPVRQGRYEVQTDPLLLRASDRLPELVLIDDAGTRDVLGLEAVSERPFKLLLGVQRPADVAWAPDRFAVLSPEP